MKRESARGFTLVELMAVISIVSLMASLLIGNVANARKKAQYANAATQVNTMRIALENYYENNNTWPTMTVMGYADTLPGHYWDTLMNELRPYMSQVLPLYPSVGCGNLCLSVGAMYMRYTPAMFMYANNTDSSGVFTGCAIVCNGYYLDFVLPESSPASLGDHGIDPDGIEFWDGQAKVFTNQSQCTALESGPRSICPI